MINKKAQTLSEQNYPKCPCQEGLARFTRIIFLLGQGVLF